MSFFKRVGLPPTYQLLLTSIFPRGKWKVLDLGCGSGIAGELLNATHEHEFTGVDIFEPYLKKCKQKGFYDKTIKADLTKIKLQPKSYDVILLLQVLEHLDKKDSSLLLKKVSKAAKKAVIVTVPNGDCVQEEYDQNSFHIHKSTWAAGDLSKLGFKVYGQAFKPIFGSKSYGAGEKAMLWQKIAVPLSTLIFPIIYFFPEIGAQLVAVKYTK